MRIVVRGQRSGAAALAPSFPGHVRNTLAGGIDFAVLYRSSADVVPQASQVARVAARSRSTRSVTSRAIATEPSTSPGPPSLTIANVIST